MRLPFLRRFAPPVLPEPLPEPPQQAMSASVATVQLDGVGWQTWRPGGHAWQNEGWRLYDITGQLRFVSNWIGQSVSRCRLYVAEVDESGEAGAEVTDPDIAQLAAGPLGSGPAKDEALRLLGINLFVPGEAYIVAESGAGDQGEDRWFVVSGYQMRRAGEQIIIRRSLLHGGGDMVYRPGVDLILRVWTPHPKDTDQPDSPTRSAIPDLRLIEAIRKREFAELDSRLAGAGMLPLPDGVDFPRGPDDDATGVQGFTDRLGQTMSRSMSDRSSAEAMVPIMFTVPIEALGKIQPVTFWSPLSAELIPLFTATVISLAQSLDVPPEVLLGSGDQNHWCTTPDTEILTLAGWKTYDQLTVGEAVLTLDHVTGQAAWQPLLAISTWDVEAESMLAIKAVGHSSVTSMWHRWPVVTTIGNRVWRSSADIVADADGSLIGPEAAVDLAGADLTVQPYTGTIWCPTTPNATWLARHEGTVFYTGNSAWQTSEEAITTQVQPVLSRIADALTTGYLRVVLEEMGEDPTRFTYAFDVGPLVVRPNRSTDALNYHGAGIISDEAAVTAGAFKVDELTSPEERVRRILETAAAATPELLSDPVVWKLLGMTGPPPSGLAPAPPPAPIVVAPAGPPQITNPTGPPDPGQPKTDPTAPPGQPAPAPKNPGQPTPQPANPGQPTPHALDHTAAVVAVSGQATRRALAYAGARLVSHGERARIPALARHQLHTHHGAITADHADQVLRGAWDDLPAVAEELHLDPNQLEHLLHGFAVELLTRGMAYDQVLLRDLVLAAMRGRRLNEALAVAA